MFGHNRKPDKLDILIAKYENDPDKQDILSILKQAKAEQDANLQQELFQTAQGQTQATAPGPIGQQVAFQPRTMVNPSNLPGIGGSLLQMSPPFDPSVRRQLQQGNRKREDELFGTRMFFT